jgi:hypothetical protein
MGGTISISNPSNQQLIRESSTLNSISVAAMMVGWTMTHTLYYRDIFRCIQFHQAHLPFQAHLNFQLVCFTHSAGCRFCSKMNTGDLWWGTQDYVPARATFVPVICASEKTHVTKFSHYQKACLQYLMFGTIRKDNCWTPEKHSWILASRIPCPPKCGKNIGEAWHPTVSPVLSQPGHLDIGGPGLKWDCADGFQL